MSFCKNCGSNIPADSKFCPNCGTAAVVEEPVQPRPQFCKSCGTEVGENKFCPNCGTPVEAASVATAVRPAQGSSLSVDVLKARFNALDTKKWVLLIAVCAPLLLAILPMFLPFYSASASAFGFSASQSVTLYDGNSGMAFFMFLLFAGSAVMAALPLITGKPYSAGYYVPGLVVEGLFAMWVLSIALLGSMFGSAASSLSMGSVSAGVEFGGWLTILLAIAGFVTSIMCMTGLKKTNPVA